MISGPLSLTAVIVGATLLAFWLDRTVPAMGRIGASLLALVLGATLSNTNLVPASSPVYDAIAGPVVMLAIAWLLLAVNVSDLKLAGPRMLAGFVIALAGTALGAFGGAFFFASGVGPEAWKLAGTLTGTYSGGSLNFVAVGRGLEMSPALFTGATAADAFMGGVWLVATLVLPLWIGRWYPPVPASALAPRGKTRRTESVAPPGSDRGPARSEEAASHPFFARVPLSTLGLAKLAALGAGLYAAAQGTKMLLEGLSGRGIAPGWVGDVPAVLWLTTFALVVGHTKWMRRPDGAMQLGNLALHFFFVVIGIWSRGSEILAVGLDVFFYTAVVILVHGVFVYGVGRLAGLDVGTLSVASQAAVGGPPSALAVAVSRRWPGFILPGVIVGLIGYALGTYLGFAVAYAVRGLGAGG